MQQNSLSIEPGQRDARSSAVCCAWSPGNRQAVDCYGIYLPSWFSFIHAGRILRGLYYVKTLLLAKTYFPYDTASDRDSADALADTELVEINLYGKSPRELFQSGSGLLDPHSLSVYIGRAYRLASHPLLLLSFTP